MAATLERATYENGNATACELQAAVSSVLDGYDINVIYGDELQQKPSYRPFHAKQHAEKRSGYWRRRLCAPRGLIDPETCTSRSFQQAQYWEK